MVRSPLTTTIIGLVADIPEGMMLTEPLCVAGPLTTLSALWGMLCTNASIPLGVCSSVGMETEPMAVHPERPTELAAGTATAETQDHCCVICTPIATHPSCRP